MDVEVEIYFTGDSVNLLRRGVAQSLPSGPSGRETVHHFMAEAAAHGARFLACSEAMQERDLTAQDLVDEVSAIGGAAAFVARVLDEEWATLTY